MGELSFLDYFKVIGTAIPIFINIMIIQDYPTSYDIRDIRNFTKDDLLTTLLYLCMFIANCFLIWGVKHNQIYLVLTIVCTYILWFAFNIVKEKVGEKANA